MGLPYTVIICDNVILMQLRSAVCMIVSRLSAHDHIATCHINAQMKHSIGNMTILTRHSLPTQKCLLTRPCNLQVYAPVATIATILCVGLI